MVEGSDHGADFLPLPAHQPQEKVGQVDAQGHGRAADLGFVFSAPGHIVIILSAVPEGVADANQRPAQGMGLDQLLDMLARGAKAPLKHRADIAPGTGFGLG